MMVKWSSGFTKGRFQGRRTYYRSVQSLPLREITLLQIRLISSKGFEVSLLQNDSTSVHLENEPTSERFTVDPMEDEPTTDRFSLYRLER